MNPVIVLSAAEQVAAHLKNEILHGRIQGQMPGIHKLAGELSANHKTVKSALLILEGEGILASQGNGKSRSIVLHGNSRVSSMRIGVLLYEPSDRKVDYVLDLQHRLSDAGYMVKIPPKTLTELGKNVERVKKLVDRTDADAWIVMAGSSSVLEWFASQSFPVFGLFGRVSDLNIAAIGPKKSPALVEVVRKLVDLGHRRIVMLAREERRKPEPGFFEQTFLEELKNQGIATGDFNLPDWEETPEGLRRLLDSLFSHTPPTALLIEGAPFILAIQQHLSRRGLMVPRDVSLVSSDPESSFYWCDPPVSHIHFDSLPWILRIVQWADNISRGKKDLSQSFNLAKFIEGGTIGPAPKNR